MADRRVLSGLAGLLLVGVLAAGCGAQGDPDPVPVGPTPSVSESPSAEPSQTAEPSSGPGASPIPVDEGDAGTREPAPADVLPTAAPVPLDEPADFGTEVTAAVDDVRAIQAQAQGPGETSGPALVFTITFTNGSSESVDLGSVTVNLSGSDGAPGVPMIGPPSSPVSGTIAAGASAAGVYVFALDRSEQDRVRLEVTYSTQAPVVAFEGSPGV